MNFESPFPRGLRRQRQAFSTPSCSAIRAPDSGYGTLSPHSPSAALKEFSGFDIDAAKCLSRLGDGNQSEVDDPFADSDEENALANRFTAALKLASDVPSRKTKPVTLPRLTRSRSSLPQSFRAADNEIHLPRRQTNITVARQGAGSLRAPDRFIPLRSTSTNTTERFRVGKAPHELSATEKILRHNGATEDAFCYRRRVVSPMVAEISPQPVSDSAPRRRRGMSIDTLERGARVY
jgi:meiosis-specific APC/C activator protein AMA1